jgi:hypothetical protein
MGARRRKYAGAKRMQIGKNFVDRSTDRIKAGRISLIFSGSLPYYVPCFAL